MVSLEADNGKPLMIMKRVGFHGNDLESVEKLNALARRICAQTPDPAVAQQWLSETLRLRPLPTSGKVDLGASKLLQTLRERRQSLL